MTAVGAFDRITCCTFESCIITKYITVGVTGAGTFGSIMENYRLGPDGGWVPRLLVFHHQLQSLSYFSLVQLNLLYSS